MAAASETNGLQGHMPPQNLDAEMGVLGSILLMPEVLDDVADKLQPECFYSNRHEKMFSCITEMRSDGITAVDAVTLAEELDRRKWLDEIGGVAYLESILAAVPNAAHAVYYANIVRDRWLRRKLVYTCTEVLEGCYSRVNETVDVIESAEKMLGHLVDQTISRKDVLIRDVLVDVWNTIQDRKKRGEAEGMPTGLRNLDVIAKIKGSQLIVLGARPACGKTSLAAQIGADFARRKIGTLIISLEMSRGELAERLLCAYGKISGDRLKSPHALEDFERDSIMLACGEFSECPLRIDDEPEMTVTKIASKARSIHRKEGLGCLIVDYLQLVEPEDRRVPREQQVAYITRKLKQLARELNIPVFALAQLNRQTENRDDKRPRLADLRESGAVEQDADIVMFLHRPELYDPEERRGEADLIVAKNRSGKVGTAKLAWIGERCEFKDLSDERYAAADRASMAFGGRPSQDNWE